MTASHRSIVPTIPGVPSWGAVLIAITFTAVGFAFDAGSGREGTDHYLCWRLHRRMHCRSARGAAGGPVHRRHSATAAPVRHRAWRLLPLSRRRDRRSQGPGDQLWLSLDRALSVDVLHLGDRAVDRDGPLVPGHVESSCCTCGGDRRRDRRACSLSSRPRSPACWRANLRTRRPRRPLRGVVGSIRSTGRARRARRLRVRHEPVVDGPVKRAQPSRSRHTRPPETEIIEPVAERPRRPRTARRTTDPTVPPAEPRRRPRASSAREPRKQPPPSERRSPYQRPDRHSRFDGFEPFEPQGTKGSNGGGSLNGTHHPVSRVRYRGADDDEEQRPAHRTRPRASKHQADAWEYDV